MIIRVLLDCFYNLLLLLQLLVNRTLFRNYQSIERQLNLIILFIIVILFLLEITLLLLVFDILIDLFQMSQKFINLTDLNEYCED